MSQEFEVLAIGNKEGKRMNTKPTINYESLKARVQELEKGPANRAAIEEKLRKFSSEGIPKKAINPVEMIANKLDILDSVQIRAEEYEQVDQSCAKSPVLAVMEEFGYGDIKIITSLSALPGVALTGETCGAVLGGLISIGAYFGSDDLLDYGANARTYAQSRKFLNLFMEKMGTTKCREIHEKIIFGRYHNVADTEKGYPAFLEDKGFEKCGLPPGISARIVAQIILENMEKKI